MSGSIRKRRDLSAVDESEPRIATAGLDEPTSDLEVYSKEVLMSLITDNLPPTPNNFSLYFDRLLEEKSDALRKQINAILEFEVDTDDDKTIELEKNLKSGFSSIKNILQVTANLYKNMSLMTKILDKRKAELANDADAQTAMSVVASLETDVYKLNGILKKQISQMKDLYDDTADIVKNVENETIFDNQYGVYNKRYLLSKITQEIQVIKEFKHKSTLITLELSKTLEENVANEKAIVLMTRTIARLLMKTSRRSDIVSHYGNGVFAMLLKHTDITSATKASERLIELVSSSNFFLAEKEIQLKISIGIADINPELSTEEILVGALDAMAVACSDDTTDYAIVPQKEKTE